MDTVWAALILQGKKIEDLTERQKQTVLKIMTERESITVNDLGMVLDLSASQFSTVHATRSRELLIYGRYFDKYDRIC